MEEHEFDYHWNRTAEGYKVEYAMADGYGGGIFTIRQAYELLALYDGEGIFVDVWRTNGHPGSLESQQIRHAVTALGRSASDVERYLDGMARITTPLGSRWVRYANAKEASRG